MEKIIVVGAGTMGAGIAFIAAAAGYAVDLIEPSSAAQDNAKHRIAKQSHRANILDAPDRVNYYCRINSGTQATLAIEAVPEDLQLKREVFDSLCAELDAKTLLATNTSSLSVSEIAESVKRPDRVLGMHFFNPPAAMKLIEIVRGEQTSDEAVEQAGLIARRFGKTAVVTADTPGFIVNRVARPFYLQALRAYEAGVAPMSDLDRLARGAGFPMGPFELMDRIGLDVNLATSQSVYERTGAARLEPVDLQRDFVAQGRLGRKTGAGFYEYRQDAREHDDDIPSPLEDINADERIVIIGYAGVALELQALLSKRYAHVELWQTEETLDDITLDTTMVFDVGDGVHDRTPIVERLDRALPPETAIFVDAYSSDLTAMARRLSHAERLIGYGILASLERQRIVEIVDAHETDDDALELAQDLFESIGCGVCLVANSAGLFLGRTIGSIINEAMYAVDEGVASPADIDLAMRLGTNYPLGPIQWGREIGGDRVARILQRLAGAEGAAFAPHRTLWLLDAPDEEQAVQTPQFEGVAE